jgi:cation diffusion facilitator CzcD-associated flavoprotein CzcO
MSQLVLSRTEVEVLVVGAGPTGLGAATRLTQAEHDDWLLIDAFAEVHLKQTLARQR